MTQYRSNPLMAVPGLLFIVVGFVVMLSGVAYAFASIVGVDMPDLAAARSGPNAAEDFGPFLDGFAVIVIGFTVLTIGRYLWRGRRLRGFRDRLGRLLIIVGYIVVAVAMVVLTRFILDAMGDSDGRNIVFQGLLVCLIIAVPGVILAMVGLRLAKEVALMQADAKATAD
jgi:hypothetical protein